MRLRLLERYASVSILAVCACAAFAQEAPPAPPLTPAQQHENDIRVYDPLDKSNPAAPAQGSAPAADTPPATPAPAASQQAPLPGSAAAGNDLTPKKPHRDGPQVLANSDSAPVQEYAGPAVLSRSYTISRPLTPQELRWSPFIGVSEVYDTGLTGGKVNPDGSLSNVGAFGTLYRWGVNGRHFWKHDQAGIDYSGNYTTYGGNTSYSGSNHLLNADFSHEFTSRMTLNLVESGSITSQGNSLINESAMVGVTDANLNLAASPQTAILDQGTRQFNSMLDLTWRQSARLSFNFGGGFFVVDRTGGLGLYGNTGYQARADVNYRYSRRMTIGVYYSYVEYAYAHHIETSNINTFGGIFSYSLGHATQFRSRVGVATSESNGLNSISIDPTIAALIGRSSVIVDQYRQELFSDISAELVRDFGRNRTANISYARGISPGNGLLMTSVQQTGSGSFTMTLFRRYKANVALGYSQLSSASQTLGQYSTTYGTLNFARDFRHGLSGNLQFDYRHFTLTNSPVLQSQFRISTGVTWGLSDGRIW